MKKNVVIISGGTIRDAGLISRTIALFEGSVIICADGGLRHLTGTSIVPDLIIGDMDSADETALDDFMQRGSRIERHPAHKDETDTELALARALEMKPDHVFIFGALGGRIDHTMANISLLVRAAECGVDAVIRDEACELFIVKDRREIRGAPGDTVSLLPLAGEVSGVTLKGFEYPLADAVMRIGVPCGISNRLSGATGTITVKSGHLLVVRFFGEVA
jgi:thiamine pyrophosphokinase